MKPKLGTSLVTGVSTTKCPFHLFLTIHALHRRFQEGYTAVAVASFYGHVYAVEIFLENGVYVYVCVFARIVLQ